ncbi:response regulator [uncultured Maricaulis sp.]|jgi:CheY-like chemotaxis protein|uniref:response regulator n=1 Tax=uncultured Maricaulis sp. TaxID=174710 RepID=UPI0025F8CEF8|nr:response regulator [uncultured Maricaulis sp.]
MPNEPLAGLRILVVEDTASIRTLVIKLLERLGCADVFEAADSETAWHHLRRQTLDAVLLDYELHPMMACRSPGKCAVTRHWRTRMWRSSC